MQQRLITTKAAAKYLGVSASFLERDRWAGAIVPFVRVGTRAIRYDLEELNQHISDNAQRLAPAQRGES